MSRDNTSFNRGLVQLCQRLGIPPIETGIPCTPGATLPDEPDTYDVYPDVPRDNSAALDAMEQASLVWATEGQGVEFAVYPPDTFDEEWSVIITGRRAKEASPSGRADTFAYAVYLALMSAL